MHLCHKGRKAHFAVAASIITNTYHNSYKDFMVVGSFRRLECSNGEALVVG